jgi:hypothetical protein
MLARAAAAFILLFPSILLGQQREGMSRSRRFMSAERSAMVWSPTISRAASAVTLNALAGPADWPRWVRWGLVGAAAGAITFPLLRGLASDGETHVGRDAMTGALGGFVLVGGSIAIWDALCAGNTRSRRAGLCGRR